MLPSTDRGTARAQAVEQHRGRSESGDRPGFGPAGGGLLHTKRHATLGRLRLRGRLPLALPPPLPRRRLRRCGVSGGEHGLAQREGLLELVEVAPVLRGLLRALLLDLLQLRQEVLVALDELPVGLLRCGEIRRWVRAARTLCVCAGDSAGLQSGIDHPWGP